MGYEIILLNIIIGKPQWQQNIFYDYLTQLHIKDSTTFIFTF